MNSDFLNNKKQPQNKNQPTNQTTTTTKTHKAKNTWVLGAAMQVSLQQSILHFFICVHAWVLSRELLFVTPLTVACPSCCPWGCSRQEEWSRLPCPSPGHLPKPRIQPTSLMSPELAGRFFIIGTTQEALDIGLFHILAIV